MSLRICCIIVFTVLIKLNLFASEKKDLKPNILFIMSDDHSYQTISAYDQRFINTPNIDRIGNEGVIFRNSFVGNSICAPSRASILTGKHSHVNGLTNNRVVFDGSQQTFPKLLRKAGYETALIGKWHLKSVPTGFDYWSILVRQGHYYNPEFIEMGDTSRYTGYVTNLTTDFALKWLNNREKSKPFCLLLHNKAPHSTWQPDTADFAEFRNKSYPLPENYWDSFKTSRAGREQTTSMHGKEFDIPYYLKMEDDKKRIETLFPKWDHTVRMNKEQRDAWNKHYKPKTKEFIKSKRSGKELDEWKYQRYMQDYLACIRSVDNNVGRVLKYLEDNDLMDNTLIVYVSDQGHFMGEHGLYDKRIMFEEVFRTPLLMKLPKNYSQKGNIYDLVQNIDYAPTILDIAGVGIPKDMQGISLKPLLKNGTKPDRNALYYHYYEYPNPHNIRRHVGIRTKRYKLIHYYFDFDEWELYDLEKDPLEMNNLITSVSHKELITELKEKLSELQEYYHDTDKSTY